MRHVGRILLLTVGVLACAPAGDAPPAFTPEDDAAIRALIDEWARTWVDGDTEATVALLTEDYFEARSTAIDSRAAALERYAPFSGSYTQVTPTVLRVEGVGDLAHAWMGFENRYTTEEGERRIQTGNGLWVVKRMPDGQWRFAASGWQSTTRPDSTAM